MVSLCAWPPRGGVSRSSGAEPREESVSLPEAREFFTKGCRLTRPAEFRRVYRNGVKSRRTFGLLFSLKSADGSAGPRLGVTVTRKEGGAVVRNRLKRKMREAFRRTRGELPAAWEFVVNMNARVLTMPPDILEREFVRAALTAASDRHDS
jgi:ribonuclease P protein component